MSNKPDEPTEEDQEEFNDTLVDWLLAELNNDQPPETDEFELLEELK